MEVEIRNEEVIEEKKESKIKGFFKKHWKGLAIGGGLFATGLVAGGLLKGKADQALLEDYDLDDDEFEIDDIIDETEETEVDN